MNEIELLRKQLRLERQHACEVATRVAGPDRAAEAAQQSCVEYLASALARFEDRDQRLQDLATRHTSPELTARSLRDILAAPGTSREALARLERTLAARPTSSESAGRWQEFLDYCAGPWRSRREAIESHLAEHATVAQWRAVSAIDADSILEERSRYAKAAAAGTRPSGA